MLFDVLRLGHSARFTDIARTLANLPTDRRPARAAVTDAVRPTLPIRMLVPREGGADLSFALFVI